MRLLDASAMLAYFHDEQEAEAVEQLPVFTTDRAWGQLSIPLDIRVIR